MINNRFTVRWCNGYWVTFDLQEYQPVEQFNRNIDAQDRLVEVFANK